MSTLTNRDNRLFGQSQQYLIATRIISVQGQWRMFIHNQSNRQVICFINVYTGQVNISFGYILITSHTYTSTVTRDNQTKKTKSNK